MTGTLEGKVALVTGAGSGIGRASAVTFAGEGAKVIVADVDVNSGEATAHQIEEAGGNSAFVKADVSQQTEVEAMVNKAIEIYGRLDCAFNNAGIEGTLAIPIAEYAEEVWDRVISVNLKGVWLCMKYELPQMLKQGGGAIVNMASVAGLVGGTVGAAYFASKHGVVGLTKAPAIEYGQSAIRINAVCPGVIQTRMGESLFKGNPDPEAEARIIGLHPIGRIGTPEEVAESVIWLCSDASSFVTGHAMAVDGGYVAL